MNPKEIIFTCQYLEHLKEPINGFCFNLKCKDKTQFCIKCVMNKHFDHKERDCKTIYEIQQMTQNDIGQMPNWIQLAIQTFRKVEKAHEGLAKLILGERDYLIELKKNLKTSNYYLFNKDFLRLKNLNIVIRKMLSPKYKKFFLCILKVMNKIQQTLDNLGESKIYQRKQEKETFELNVNFEQIVQLDLLFNNQMIVCCENEQCFDQQQCCQQCYMKNNKEQLIFVVIMPIIEMQITIANQYLFAVETYFKNGQQLYQHFKEFLENQEILFKNIINHLQVQDLYQFMLKLKKMKKWYKLKEMNVKNENYNILSNILDKLILLSKTIFKQIQGVEKKIIFIKQFNKQTQLKEVNFKKEVKSQELCNKGDKLRYRSRGKDAISIYDKAIKMNPKYISAYNNKGLALEQLNKFEDAILCYNQAIEIDPNNEEAYKKKGNALEQLNKYEDAILCYNQAIEIDPNNEEAYTKKGNALEQLNKCEDAILCYNQAIKINPSKTKEMLINIEIAQRHIELIKNYYSS